MTIRHKMTSRTFAVLAIAACLLIIYVLAANLASAAPEDSESIERALRPLTVVTRVVEQKGQFFRKRKFTGSIKAARRSMLSFEKFGKISAIHVEEGDFVKAGQIVGTVDVQQIAAQYAATRAQLEQARAVLQELIAGPRKETIAATRAKLTACVADAKRLQLNYNRSLKLISQSAISQEQLDEARYTLDFANAQRDAVQQELNELMAGTRAEQISAQEAAVTRLEAETAKLRLDVEDGQLTAPYSGRVVRRLLDEGTVVSNGEPVLEIVEDSRLEAWIGIPQTAATSMVVGGEYEASVDTGPIRLTLASLRPSLDDTTKTQNLVFSVHVVPNQNLVPGQIVRIALEESVDTQGFEIPSTALVPAPRGLWNVFVVGDGNRVEQRSVELLHSLGEQSIVSGTLRTGDVVLVEGIHRAVAGQVVAPVGEETELER